ncbi:MAG: sulfur carrier protein ThiS [Bryobacterales bacterium]|nr:sulfur carrier protein ThiS [Bryobacterales bacterium]
MQIQVNGESHKFPAPVTVLELLLQLEIEPSRVAVELDKKIVKQRDWPRTIVNDGSRLEIVRFVGGG